MSDAATANWLAYAFLSWLRITTALGLMSALMWGVGALPLLLLVSVPIAWSVATYVEPAVLASASQAVGLVQGGLELLLGALLGASLLAPLLAMRFAGAVGDVLLRPAVSTKHDPLTKLYGLFAAAVVAAVGGLRVVSEVLIDSLVAWPPGTLLSRLWDAPLLSSLRLLADAFEWSLLFAGPLVLGVLLALLILALLSRLLSPQGAALIELLPLRTLLVVALCMVSLAALGPGLQEHFADAARRARALTTP